MPMNRVRLPCVCLFLRQDFRFSDRIASTALRPQWCNAHWQSSCPSQRYEWARLSQSRTILLWPIFGSEFGSWRIGYRRIGSSIESNTTRRQTVSGIFFVFVSLLNSIIFAKLFRLFGIGYFNFSKSFFFFSNNFSSFFFSPNCSKQVSYLFQKCCVSSFEKSLKK